MQASTIADPRPFRSLLTVAVAALLLLLAAFGAKGYQDLKAAQARESELEARIAEKQARIAALARRVERLAGDPATLERLAREELWMARPADVVIVLPPEPGQEPPLAAPGARRKGSARQLQRSSL